MGGGNVRSPLRTADLSYSAEGTTHRLTCRILGPDNTDHSIWYEVTGNLPELMHDRADAFVLPGILLAMRLGVDFDITLPISDRLASNLPDIALVLSIQLGKRCPVVTHGETIPAEAVPAAPGAVTGMSCGVDSFFTLKEYYFDGRYRSRKITHFLHNQVGANTTPHKHEQTLRSAQAVARELGIDLLSVTSNMHDVLGLDFQATHTARNLSVAYLLGKVASCFYHSSAYAYKEIGIYPTYDSAYGEPILLQLTATPNMDMISAGSVSSRLQKTLGIKDMNLARRYLDVCVDHTHTGPTVNCSKCWKCCRTLLTLELAGVLEEFTAVFDLDAYYAVKPQYLGFVHTSKHPNDHDAFLFASSKGVRALPHWIAINYGKRVLKKLRRMAGRA